MELPPIKLRVPPEVWGQVAKVKMDLPPIRVSGSSSCKSIGNGLETPAQDQLTLGQSLDTDFQAQDETEINPVLEQLVTHIPDLIAYRVHNAPLPQTIHSYGVVMFADISGFTALCEKYCSGARSKSDGTDQLTSTLNSYLSQIVQAILDAGGDILKFAGDALLAYWSCSRFAASGTLAYVIQESLQMQNDYDNFQSSDGDILRMKLAVSVGKVQIHYIGNTEYKTFDVTGEAIDDVNEAQSFAKPGTVIISKGAWDMSNKQRCFAKHVGPGCAQVSEMLPEEEEQETTNAMTALMGNEKRKQTLTNIVQSARQTRIMSSAQHRSSEAWDDGNKRNSVSSKKKATAGSSAPPKALLHIGKGLSSRPEVKGFLPKMSLEAQQGIRPFILKTVVDKVEHGHEVSWLSELREVCVLFINLDPGKTLNAADTLKLLHTSFDVIYPSLRKFDGTLNKVFMFDKGCTYLCIFGLPHAKHEDEAARALRAARDIFNHLGELDIQQYSIGVTTGVAFCGVVGHPQRHEYTVIGQKVNMAARLMMKFPNVISCDETTRSKSSGPDNEFTLAPPVTLKGISKPENIYTFSIEVTQTLHHYNSDMHLPTDVDDLIGRDKEMSVFLEELMHVSEHTPRDPGVIILSGSGGMGKTKILRAMKAKAGAMGFRIVSGIGGLVEKNTPFFTVKTLITRLLELDSCKNIHEREQLILEHITDDKMKHLLPLLNDILVLKFPQSHITSHMSHDERTAARHKLLYSIVHQEALTKPCVFGIDDAHWIDHDSWSFLIDLALDPNAILVLTTRPLERLKEKHPAMLEILNHPHTRVVKLEGLKMDDMITIACRLLKVDSIPDMLQQIIRKRSHGVPLWCEELVETMLELNYLEVVEKDDIIQEEDETNSACSSNSAIGIPSQMSRTSGRKVILKAKPRRSSTAQLSSGITIGDIPIPDSVAGMVLTRIDRLSPPGQMSLKCAAVIGTTFNKSMLEAMIPNCNPVVFHQSLNPLAEAGMVECAIAAQLRNMNADINTRSGHHLPVDDANLHCPCLQKDHSLLKPASHGPKHHISHHPPVDDCHMLQFVHTYLQETAYGLWTESQRRALHEAAAIFLESQAHKCKNCGGGGFIAGAPRPSVSVDRKRTSTPGGRAFVGTANMRNKLKRRNTVSSRRGSTMSKCSIDSINIDSEFQPMLSSLQESEQVTFEMNQNNTRPTTAHSRTSGVRFESICANEIIDIDMQDCHCDEILAQVYPQLVRHWRAAGDVHKTLENLIEAGSAAVATFNNMEALSLLYEAKHDILEEYGKDIIDNSELARLESLIAQALFQSGEIEECLPYFQSALRLLHTKLPNNSIASVIVLGYNAFKQLLHKKFPRKFIGRKTGKDSQMFLDQARCMTHVTHVYHLQHKNIKTFMVALKQLNTVEEAQEDIHELIEAYATMIECCQHFDFKNLANSYLETAMSHCSDVQFGVEDLHTYAHLLGVGVNLHLCQGRVDEALEMGIANHRITARMHDVAMELASLPLLFFSQITAFKETQCKESLKLLSEIAAEADDLRAQALHDCCEFDALLEFGIGLDDAHSLVKAAETCCEEDIYHFDDTERFFLVSCLALWHARQGNYESADMYQKTAQSLYPSEYETYIAVRALARYVECLLVLHKKDIAKMPKKPLNQLKVLSSKFLVFKPRQLLLSSYKNYRMKKLSKARKGLVSAINGASKMGCMFDEEWAKASRKAWFGSSSKILEQNTKNIIFILQ